MKYSLNFCPVCPLLITDKLNKLNNLDFVSSQVLTQQKS